MVMLGVSDVSRARRFYEAMGWRGQEVEEETVFFQAGGMALVLWGVDKLAEDGGVGTYSPIEGFRGMNLAQNVRQCGRRCSHRRGGICGWHRHPYSGRDLLRRIRGTLHRPGWSRLGDRLQPRLSTGRRRHDHGSRLRAVSAVLSRSPRLHLPVSKPTGGQLASSKQPRHTHSPDQHEHDSTNVYSG